MYRVRIKGSDGRLVSVLRGAHSRSVRLTGVLAFESFTATVSAEGGPNLLAGPASRTKLAGAKLRKPPRAHRKRHK